MDLGTFLNDGKPVTSWADEMEETPVSDSRTSYGGGGERRTFNATTNTYGTGSGGYSVREELPLPSKPPYTVHLGNLSFDATTADVSDFFTDCQCTNVRIIEDKEQMKPKGFGYAEFSTLDGLKKALTLNQSQFQGRSIRISVADPPKQSDRPDARELTDWSRKGPLPDLPSRGGSDRRAVSDRFGSGGRFNDAGSDTGERRREYQPDDGKVRDFSNWARKGPLSPLPQADRPSNSRDGGCTRTNDGPRGDNFRERRDSPASWGESRGQGSQEGSRPPRREFQDRPVVERAPTAAEQDNQWRAKMRPDVPVAQSLADSSQNGSAPASPAMAPAAPAGRPRLNLAKRTVPEALTNPASPSLSGDAKASPFGAARPIDTAAKEREIEEKKLAALAEKAKAEEAAKEEKRLAKEAAQLQKEKDDAAAAEAQANGFAVNAQDTEKDEVSQREVAIPEASESNGTNGAVPASKPKDISPAAGKLKTEGPLSGAWRRASAGPPKGPANDLPRDYRGGRGGSTFRGRGNNDRGNLDRNLDRNSDRQDSRGPKANGTSAPAAPASPAPEAVTAPQEDADGWSTVIKPNKNKRGGNQVARHA